MSHLNSTRPTASPAEMHRLSEQLQHVLANGQPAVAPQPPVATATFESLFGALEGLIDEEFEQCLRDYRAWG
jgi:hypothetical protein